MPRTRPKTVEPNNAWLDAPLDQEPPYSELLKMVIEAREENAALQKDLGDEWKRTEQLQGEITKLRAELDAYRRRSMNTL